MTAAENVCYTLINVASDSEPPSEVSLKADLGNGLQIFDIDIPSVELPTSINKFSKLSASFFFQNRKGGDKSKDRSLEEGHHHDPKW